MPKFTYQGSPGYEYVFADRVIAPAAGEVVELTVDEAATVGDDFAPTKSKTAPADPEGA